MKTINYKDVLNYKEVYVVYWHDGYTKGSKYSVTNLNTTYMSFYATPGTPYFEHCKDAEDYAKKLNKTSYKMKA